MMWSWEYTLEILPQILKALKITVSATLVAFAVALVVGLLLTLARRSRFKLLALFAQGFVEFVRNTPLLVQLYFIFYVLPEHGLALTPFLAGVIGLGLHYSTYLAEVYRGGIESIPPGQWEAAKALNFSAFETWKKIILPQSIPPVIPVMGNYLITMFKETPVLSAITLVEIMQTAKMLGSHSFRYLEAFTIVGALFLVLSYTSSLMVRSLEARLNLR